MLDIDDEVDEHCSDCPGLCFVSILSTSREYVKNGNSVLALSERFSFFHHIAAADNTLLLILPLIAPSNVSEYGLTLRIESIVKRSAFRTCLTSLRFKSPVVRHFHIHNIELYD